MKKLIILAANEGQARNFAQGLGLKPGEWAYLHDEWQLEGISPDTHAVIEYGHPGFRNDYERVRTIAIKLRLLV